MKKLLATLASVALLSTLASPVAHAVRTAPDLDDHQSDPAYAKYYQQKVTWVTDIAGCQSPYLPLECARIIAPRDWRNPAAGDLTLTISRLPGQQLNGRRLLLANPGGPGIGGLFTAHQIAFNMGAMASHLSIGMDPRGVGESSRFTCGFTNNGPDGAQPPTDSRHFTRATVAAQEEQMAQAFRTCAATPGTLLPYINSYQSAFDYNFVRALMGAPSSDYYGVSYGTWLGSVIKRAFGSKFDRVILDSNLDWSRASLSEAFTEQYQGLQYAHDRVIFPFLGRHDDVFHLGTSAAQVAASYERIRALAATKPGVMTPNTIDDALAAGAKFSFLITPGGKFLLAAGALLGDPASTPHMSVEEARTTVDATVPTLSLDLGSTFTTILCGDGANAPEAFRRFESLARTFPAAPWAASNPCKGWPYQPALDDAFFARPVGNILMLQNEVDGATPYNGALDARKRSVGNVKLVLVSNQYGHGVAWTPTVTATARAYLANGTLPADDVRSLPTPLSSGGVRDDKVYEYLQPSTPERPLPGRSFYLQRDLSEPKVDVEATQAWKAAHPAGAPAAAAPAMAGLRGSEATTPVRR